MVKKMGQVLGGIKMGRRVMKEFIKMGTLLMGGHIIKEMGQQ